MFWKSRHQHPNRAVLPYAEMATRNQTSRLMVLSETLRGKGRVPDPGSGGLEGEVELSGSSLLNKTYQDSAENFSRIQMCYKKKNKKGTAPISKVHS